VIPSENQRGGMFARQQAVHDDGMRCGMRLMAGSGERPAASVHVPDGRFTDSHPSFSNVMLDGVHAPANMPCR
jgi:hypothetical protein